MGEIDLSQLLGGLLTITWQQGVMVAVGGLLIYLAIAKKYEPTLLLPMGFGCILGNLPVAAYMMGPEGLFGVLKRAGIETELFPLLIFLGVGAMMDMRPLRKNGGNQKIHNKSPQYRLAHRPLQFSCVYTQ